MGSATIRPTSTSVSGAYTKTGAATEHEAIDEAVADDATTMVSSNLGASIPQDSLYGTNNPAIPAGSTAMVLTVYMRVRGNALSTNLGNRAALRVGSGASVTLGTLQDGFIAWTNYNQAFANDPATGVPWLVTAANAATIGLRLIDGNDEVPNRYATDATQLDGDWAWIDPPAVTDILTGCIV